LGYLCLRNVKFLEQAKALKSRTSIVEKSVGMNFTEALTDNADEVPKEHVPEEEAPTAPLVMGPEPLIRESTDLCDISDFQKKSGLFCIITGMENSGTTIISSIVMNAPNLYGAFELGLLLAPTPQQFRNVQPFFSWITLPTATPTSSHGWGLTNNQTEEILAAECAAEQYNLLGKYSPIYSGALNTSWLVDKTPGYVYDLYAIMQRTPKVPVIVTQKDDNSIRQSFEKRGSYNNTERIKSFHRELELVKKHFSERLFVLNYTAFTEDPDRIMTMLFSFLGLRWDPMYLTLEKFNQKGKISGMRPRKAFNKTGTNWPAVQG